MKKLVLVVAVVIMATMSSLVLVGCSIDREEMIGHWEITRSEMSGRNFAIDVRPGDPLFYEVAGYMILESDGTYTMQLGNEFFSGTWSLSGRRITFTFNQFGVTVTDRFDVRFDNAGNLLLSQSARIPELGGRVDMTLTFTLVASDS